MPPKPSPPRLTHFLCLPLLTSTSRPQLQQSLTAFRTAITKPSPENPNGISEKAIRPIGTLHLTLGVMSLTDQKEVEEAQALLRSLDLKELLSPCALPGFQESDISAPSNIAKPSEISGEMQNGNKAKNIEENLPQSLASPSLKISLRGLQTMHPPTSTSILYTSPSSTTHALLPLCQSLKDAFTTAKLLVPDDRPLLLHATILNTIYVPGVRKSGGGGAGHGKNRAKLRIDATEILEAFGGEEWVWMEDVRVEKVAICRMGARRVEGGDGDEEYVVEEEVELA